MQWGLCPKDKSCCAISLLWSSRPESPVPCTGVSGLRIFHEQLKYQQPLVLVRNVDGYWPESPVSRDLHEDAQVLAPPGAGPESWRRLGGVSGLRAFFTKETKYQHPLVLVRRVGGNLAESPVSGDFPRSAHVPALPGVTSEICRSLRSQAKVSGPRNLCGDFQGRSLRPSRPESPV